MQYAMAHTSLFSMGTDWGDINNDGLSDLIVADMLPASNKRQKMLKGPLKFDAYQLAVDYGFHHQLMRNTLQLNRANGTFSDIGMMAGGSNRLELGATAGRSGQRWLAGSLCDERISPRLHEHGLSEVHL